MNNADYFVNIEESDIFIENESKRITDDIVDQLIAYRKQLKLTQQDIADATGIKRANIARLELKKNEASLDSKDVEERVIKVISCYKSRGVHGKEKNNTYFSGRYM